jgi:F-type H+-transporting ATPase subunit b
MLELNPTLMALVLILFIGLIVYLNKALYEPLINFMDQRNLTIAKDLQEAESLTAGADNLESEANEILAKAKQEALSIRQSAAQEATQEADKLIRQKEAELEKAYEEFKAKLEQEKEEARNAILSQVPLIKEALKAKFSQL